jgi:hypothetical protein
MVPVDSHAYDEMIFRFLFGVPATEVFQLHKWVALPPHFYGVSFNE